jgi:cyclopropane fatty-acyl-phospholipid synthase-like methyltransferase
MDQLNLVHKYDHDYFECGVVTGVSGYLNYRWMPELTIRMAHHLIEHLAIERGQTILDFGCAKGFLVKAFRILDYQAFGADVSNYAISNADGDVRAYCRRIYGCDDPVLFNRNYDWMIAKDVFEHIVEPDLRVLLTEAKVKVGKMFVVVPLAADDHSGEYIVPEYNRDATHVVAKSSGWWQGFFEDLGWKTEMFATEMMGVKENWTSKWDDGNGFFILENDGR